MKSHCIPVRLSEWHRQRVEKFMKQWKIQSLSFGIRRAIEMGCSANELLIECKITTPEDTKLRNVIDSLSEEEQKMLRDMLIKKIGPSETKRLVDLNENKEEERDDSQ